VKDVALIQKVILVMESYVGYSVAALKDSPYVLVLEHYLITVL
jgi:hypothetical protein